MQSAVLPTFHHSIQAIVSVVRGLNRLHVTLGGQCVGVSIPDGTCKSLLPLPQPCQYGLLTGVVGTCPLGAYCCGEVRVIGGEGNN
jgi:hypothetical protein